MVNNYFHASDNPLNDPAQGGILKGTKDPGDITNAYYAFTAPDGRKMLFFSLKWEPRPAVMTWANQIASLPQYADHTAVLLTHNYLEADNSRSNSVDVAGDASGETLWNNLVKAHSNFEMVFNGHFGGDGEGFLDSTDNAGKTVHQMFFNTQFETMGGNGWIRLVEFLNDGKTVRVRTYSPLLDLYRTSPSYDFEFEISPLPPEPGDYNANRSVDAADYVQWRKNPSVNGGSPAGYNTWRANFGNPPSAANGLSDAFVPEPATLMPLAFTLAGWCLCRR